VIANLMGLYSVRLIFVLFLQQAIEFYNREKDEENQTYFVEKLSKLNETIRELVERQHRLQQR
jgi:hypothetical protein